MKKRSAVLLKQDDKLSILLVICLGFFLSTTTFAGFKLDRKYSLEDVGFLEPWDNMDGLFSDMVSNVYKDYFQAQGRFKFHDISQSDPVLTHSKIPYHRLIEDRDVLNQIVRTFRIGSLIRTKVYKEGPTYRFVMDWLHSPRLNIIASYSFRLEEIKARTRINEEILRPEIIKGLNELVKKIPFQGQVSGTDAEWVTLNIGQDAGIKPGDYVEVATLEDVRLHPLLNKVVDWDFKRVGRLRVERVENQIAFCKTVEEAEGQTINRYQKVVKVFSPSRNELDKAIADGKTTIEKIQPPRKPQWGWAAASAWTGAFDRQYSNSTTGKSGGGFFVGAKADGQLWLTKNVFFETALGAGFFGHNHTDVNTGVVSAGGPYSGNTFLFKANMAYAYNVMGTFFGPKGWAKLGYKTTSYNLPISVSELIAPTNFSGLFVGLGADLPIRDKFGALLSLEIGLFTSVTETGLSSGSASGVTDAAFFLGGYYKISPNMSVRAGLDISTQSADYNATGTAHSQKVIAFAPAFLYYF